MQIRKRAKSVTFGKKEKKEEVKKPVETVSADTEKTSEKATVVERRAVPEKTLPDELSATPPKTDEVVETPEVVTPPDEFISDAPASSPTEAPKAESEEPSSSSESKEVSSSDVKADEETPKVETILEPTLSPEKSEEKPDEITPAPVQSAFTIQNNGAIPDDLEGGSKKRFGVYFFVVAFLAFILGLGAMAAVTYFGNINVTAIKLPAISAPGGKPTPTAAPKASPTTAPTEKPVDLQAYTISVLNGSGVVGKASEVKASLTTAGFKVGTTGNADKSDYAKTQINVKKDVNQAFVTKLQNELKKTFIVEVSTDSSDQADVTVILGQEVVK